MARITSQQLASIVQKRLFTKAESAANPSRPVGRQTVLASLRKQIEAALEIENYSEVIERLTELRDAQNNIFWIIDTSQENISGHQILIRDARQVVDKPKEGFAGYAIMGINYIRTAKKLLAIESKLTAELNKVLASAATVFLTSISKIDDPKEDLARLCVFLKGFVGRELKIKKSEAETRLLVAKDFMELEDKSRHVVTVSEFKRGAGIECAVLEAEIALCQLTVAQQKEYEQRKQKIWYASLEPWKRKLVDAYVEKILSGKQVIPTQLRKYLVGARNFYLKVVGLIDSDEIEILTENFHSGTLAHLGDKIPEENIRITKLNVEQVSQATGGGVHMVTLNSPANAIGDDAKIVSYVKHAAKDKKHSHSSLPFNALRIKFDHVLTGIEEQLAAVVALIGKWNSSGWKISKELIAYLSNQGIVLKSLSELDAYLKEKVYTLKLPEKFTRPIILAVLLRYNIDNLKKTKEILKSSVECAKKNKTEFLDKIAGSVDPKNTSLVFAVLSNILDHALSELSDFFNTSDPYKKRIASACQSGKDRGGILMLFTAVSVLAKKFYPKEFIAELSAQQFSDESAEDLYLVPKGIPLRELFHVTNAESSSVAATEGIPVTGSVNEFIGKSQRNPMLRYLFVAIAFQIIKGGHTQFMAGRQGGTPGCFGVKSDSKVALPVGIPREVQALLILATAKFNSKMPDFTNQPKSADRFYYAITVSPDLVEEMKVLTKYALQICLKKAAKKIGNAEKYITDPESAGNDKRAKRISVKWLKNAAVAVGKSVIYKTELAESRVSLLNRTIIVLDNKNSIEEIAGELNQLREANSEATKANHAGIGETQPHLDALAYFFALAASALESKANLAHN